ncbi:hypothetical protein GCM10023321_55940 [Pseudonocardia eucalypti]|uniref:Rrf2 family transcriptional regulator n=1 Tax=Pseudonocardia eucalypti TaxID=648755 RepID=A0ABP9QPY9_9PSEU
MLILPGRGEHPGTYRRLGQRLAADGYAVRAVRTPAALSEPKALAEPRALPEPEVLADAEALAGEFPAVTGPRVLLGADSGALHAWRFAAAHPGAVDALVLAGLPLEAGNPPPTDRDAELAARTACPVHRELLVTDDDFGWGSLADPVPAPPDRLPALPVLLLHGEADQVAPVAAVRLLAARHPRAATGVVRDGLHDVLNDQFHRSVAARLVLFLEEVGKGALLLPEPTEPARPTRARRAAPLHVSARLDYALRALSELIATDALPPNEPVRCEAIARARGIPLNSLVNLMGELRRAGLVRSQRGCEGGYWLARPAPEITITDVVRAVEGEVISLHADGPDTWLWHRLGQTVTAFLDGWTVREIAGGDGAGLTREAAL